MVHHIRKAFFERVDQLEWMDDETKIAATEKALAMTEFIGFPDWFANSTALSHYYEGVSVCSTPKLKYISYSILAK